MLRSIVHGFVVLGLSTLGCSKHSEPKEPTAVESLFTIVGRRLDRDVKDHHDNTAATVFRTEGDHAYLVAVSHGLHTSLGQLQKASIDSEFFAVLGERGGTRLVPIELMFTNQSGYTIFRGPRDQLPAPVPRRPLPDVKVGDEINCVGINLANYVEPPYFDLKQQPHKVVRVGPSVKGHPAFLFFETTGVMDHGYLTDKEGRIVAAFQRNDDTRECLATAPGGAICEQGVLQEGRIRVSRVTSDELRIDFAVQTLHPFEEAQAFVPCLFIYHPSEADRSKSPYDIIQSRQFESGKKPDAIVEFEKVTSIDGIFEMPSPPNDWCRAAHWIGSYRFKESETGPVLWYRFERLGGGETSLLLNATTTESRLFKHPSYLDGQGKPIPRETTGS